MCYVDRYSNTVKQNDDNESHQTIELGKKRREKPL